MPLLVTIHTPSAEAAGGGMTKHEFELGTFGDESPLARAFGYGPVVSQLQPGGIARRVPIDGLRGAPKRPRRGHDLMQIYGRWSEEQVEDLAAACALAETPGARASIAFI